MIAELSSECSPAGHLAMLEKPDISDYVLIEGIEQNWSIAVRTVEFLPLGADIDTAAYRVTQQAGDHFFAKLRMGKLFKPAISVPDILARSGASHVIAPIPTMTGALWTRIGNYTVSLFPFVSGESGFSRRLSVRQWGILGRTLRHLHECSVPPPILSEVPTETYAPVWRNVVRSLLASVQHDSYDDPSAAGFAATMNERRSTIETILARADGLADKMLQNRLPHVLCHADIHAGTVLLTANDDLFVIDWDTLSHAPRERDLMFIGAGIGGVRNTEQECGLFYQGYGQVGVDHDAVAYFRYERIIQDVAEFGKQLLLSSEGGEDRPQALRYFAGMFAGGDAVDAAMSVD